MRLNGEKMEKLDKYGKCPECNMSWDGGDIFDSFRPQPWFKDKTDEEVMEHVKESYGEPYKFSKIVGIEDPKLYDGASWYMCPECNSRWDRWTGEIVKDDDKFKKEMKKKWVGRDI